MRCRGCWRSCPFAGVVTFATHPWRDLCNDVIDMVRRGRRASWPFSPTSFERGHPSPAHFSSFEQTSASGLPVKPLRGVYSFRVPPCAPRRTDVYSFRRTLGNSRRPEAGSSRVCDRPEKSRPTWRHNLVEVPDAAPDDRHLAGASPASQWYRSMMSHLRATSLRPYPPYDGLLFSARTGWRPRILPCMGASNPAQLAWPGLELPLTYPSGRWS